MNTLKFSNCILRHIPTHASKSSFPFQNIKNGLLSSSIQRNFAYTASSSGGKDSKTETYNMGSAIITRADTNLATSSEWQEGASIEDRFKLSQIHDIKKIFQILRQSQYKHPLNDLVHFLRRIVEINDEKNLKLSVMNSG